MDRKVSVFYVDNITCVCPKLHGRRKYFFLSNSSLGVALSVDFSMLRRKPTRLELKLDDIEEFESIRKDLETRKKQKEDVEVVGGSDGEGAAGVSSDPKSREQMINDRIGYKPQPKPNDRSSQFGSFEF